MVAVDKNRFAGSVAVLLLDTGSVTINASDWYVFTSGIRSPIYCDMRWLGSFTKERSQVLSYLTLRLTDEVPSEEVDLVAGVATAGIPYAAWLSERLDKPMVYVRETTKGHGKGQQIEGRVLAGQRGLVVEDLITTGGSAIQTAQTLREAGAHVSHCLAIFEYGLPNSERAFRDAGISRVTLCNIRDLLEVALSTGRLSEAEGKIVGDWFEDYSSRAGAEVT